MNYEIDDDILYLFLGGGHVEIKRSELSESSIEAAIENLIAGVFNERFPEVIEASYTGRIKLSHMLSELSK